MKQKKLQPKLQAEAAGAKEADDLWQSLEGIPDSDMAGTITSRKKEETEYRGTNCMSLWSSGSPNPFSCFHSQLPQPGAPL